MWRKEPRPSDFRWHEILVAGLISLGQRILKQIERVGTPQEFQKLGFHLDAAEAQLRVLRQNWEKWHGTVDSSRLKTLQDSLSVLSAQEPFC